MKPADAMIDRLITTCWWLPETLVLFWRDVCVQVATGDRVTVLTQYDMMSDGLILSKLRQADITDSRLQRALFSP